MENYICVLKIALDDIENALKFLFPTNKTNKYFKSYLTKDYFGIRLHIKHFEKKKRGNCNYI